MTTVGYGDIIATSNEERIYAIFSMLLGASVFGYIVGSMAAVVGQGDVAQARVRTHLNNLGEYFAEGQVDHSQLESLNQHFEYYYQCRSPCNEKELLKLMSAELRRECLVFLNRNVVHAISFMRELFTDEATFIVALVSKMEPVLVMAGEILYRQVVYLSSLYLFAVFVRFQLSFDQLFISCSG
jgi:hypothetical protein